MKGYKKSYKKGAEKHMQLKLGQLNNYKSYQKKLKDKVIANTSVNILKVELFLSLNVCRYCKLLKLNKFKRI